MNPILFKPNLLSGNLVLQQPQNASTSTKSAPVHSEVLHFAGVTGNLRGRHWLSPGAFQKLLNVSSSPYVGLLPAALVQAVPSSPKHVYRILDELASLLEGEERRHTAFEQALIKNNLRFEFKIGDSNTPVSLEGIDSGSQGAVYKLTINQQPFAFKVFYDKNQVSKYHHGNFGECSTGLYLSDRKWKDLASFHCANPQAGWALFEFISDEMTAESRVGSTYKNLQAILGDDGGSNCKNGIRLDYGGIYRGKQVNVETLDDFKQALKSEDPAIQSAAAWQIVRLPEEAVQEAFQLAMQTDIPAVQVNVINNLYLLPQDLKKEVFQRVMMTGNSVLQASAAGTIHCLPSAFRKEAFQQAMKTGEPSVQVQAVKSLASLPVEYRKEAFQQAMATGNPDVQANIVVYIKILDKTFQLEAFRQAIQTGHSLVQKNATQRLEFLSDGVMPEAFQLAMQTRKPLVQAAAACSISALPDGLRENAYKQAIRTGNRLVQASAASQIPFLPDEFTDEARQMFIEVMEENTASRYLKDFRVVLLTA